LLIVGDNKDQVSKGVYVITKVSACVEYTQFHSQSSIANDVYRHSGVRSY